jgi:predicted metal-dependent phosphotriesterase family hydrolase
MGLRKVIVTHPIYQLINMPIEVQKKLAEMGAYIEHTYAMHFIDKISYDEIVNQIKEVGPDYCILTSDVGQQFSPNPDEALFEFASSLIEGGLTYSEIYRMLVDNPIRLLR